MARKLSPREEQRATYTTLTGLFLSTVTGFAMFKTRQRKKNALKPFEFVQLALATYRLGRLISYDKVFEPYRSPFTRTVPDPSGEGMTVVPKGKGARSAIGDLIACPVCAGTWVAALLVYGLDMFPNVTRVFLNIMSAVGAAELLDAATEHLQWQGQLAREKAGKQREANEEGSNHEPFIPSRLPARLGQDIPRRRFDDREWKRPSPVQQNQERP